MMDINTKKFIVDNSFIVAPLFPDEVLSKDNQKIYNQFLFQKIKFYAPTLLKYEFGNTLRSNIKRGRTSQQEATQFLDIFLQYTINYKKPNFKSTLNLSITHNLSFYDASYLALSVELNAPLLTLDKNLQKAYNLEIKNS